MKIIKCRSLSLLFCFAIILLLPLTGKAQLEKMVNMSIDEAASFIAPYFENQVDVVRLVSLGTPQGKLREPMVLNNAIAAYLIKNKGFKTLMLHLADWELRPFSIYLQNDKALLIPEFDSLFHKTFHGTSLHNQESRIFFIWLKNYNLSNRAGKVYVVGSGLLQGRSKFKEMNKAFIDNYVRPFSQLAADTLTRNWHAASTAADKEFDDTVLDQMYQWKEAVNQGKVAMPEVLKVFMELDYSQRLACFAGTFLTTETNSNFAELHHAGKYKLGMIETLMKNPSTKTVMYVNQMESANTEIFLSTGPSEIRLPLSGMEYKKLYKQTYLNTATTFADSATIWGSENNVAKKLIFKGAANTKTLLSKKSVYNSQVDSLAMRQMNIPFFTGVHPSAFTIGTKGLHPVAPFDMVFIFKSLSYDDSMN